MTRIQVGIIKPMEEMTPNPIPPILEQHKHTNVAAIVLGVLLVLSLVANGFLYVNIAQTKANDPVKLFLENADILQTVEGWEKYNLDQSRQAIEDLKDYLADLTLDDMSELDDLYFAAPYESLAESLIEQRQRELQDDFAAQEFDFENMTLDEINKAWLNSESGSPIEAEIGAVLTERAEQLSTEELEALVNDPGSNYGFPVSDVYFGRLAEMATDASELYVLWQSVSSYSPAEILIEQRVDELIGQMTDRALLENWLMQAREDLCFFEEIDFCNESDFFIDAIEKRLEEI